MLQCIGVGQLTGPIAVTATVDYIGVRNSSPESTGGLIAHELVHDAGYKQSSNDKGSDLYANTVPLQIQACVKELRPNPYRGPGRDYYAPRNILGFALDGENNYNFVWFRDGRVSAGTSDDLDKFRSPYRYSLPPGYSPNDIGGMALDGENNMVFA